MFKPSLAIEIVSFPQLLPYASYLPFYHVPTFPSKRSFPIIDGNAEAPPGPPAQQISAGQVVQRAQNKAMRAACHGSRKVSNRQGQPTLYMDLLNDPFLGLTCPS